MPSIAEVHAIPAPMMDEVAVTLTPPANGKYYVAGEAPTVTLVIRDDAGNPIDHTKVTDANFSTASLFVYGPRAKAVPVLTSSSQNVGSKLRASVSSSKPGPWDIKGKVFTIAVNGSAPQNITITSSSNLVSAARLRGFRQFRHYQPQRRSQSNGGSHECEYQNSDPGRQRPARDL